MTEDINTHRAKSIFESRMSAALRMTRASHMKKNSHVNSEKKPWIIEKSSLRKKRYQIPDKNSRIIS